MLNQIVLGVGNWQPRRDAGDPLPMLIPPPPRNGQVWGWLRRP